MGDQVEPTKIVGPGRDGTSTSLVKEDDITYRVVDDVLYIWALRPLPEGTEVFHCYGSLPGVELLDEFGFLADDNPHDYVSVHIEDLMDARFAEFGADVESLQSLDFEFP